MLVWLKTNSAVLTTMGALILFFSWITTNTLNNRYRNLTQQLSGAEDRYRLVRATLDLKGLMHGALTLLHHREYLDRAAREDKSARSTYEERLASMTRTEINAQQIYHFEEFSNSYVQKAQALDMSEALIDLQKAASLTYALRTDYEKARDEARVADDRLRSKAPSSRSDTDYAAVITAIEEFQAEYDRLLPRLTPLAKSSTEAANRVQQIIDDTLRSARRWATITGDASLWLYVLGTLLILCGQIGERFGKLPETPM